MDNTAYQQIIAAGEEVARLMQSPVFQKAYGDTVQSYTDDIISTSPAHSKERDSLVTEARALTRVMSRFRHYWQQAEAVLAQQNAQAPANGVDEYQGFGTPR